MNRNEFSKLLEERVLSLDGAYGTEFLKRGYQENLPEILNLKAPYVVRKLQEEYAEAGADLILTNTFSANRIKLRHYQLEPELEKINRAAVSLARAAASSYQLVFGDIGPTGLFLEPLGELSFERAYEIFQEQARILIEAGVDGLILETMSDLKELKAAILAIRDLSPDLPLIAQMTFDEKGISVTGTSVNIFAALLNDLDVDVLGVNCFLTPDQMLPVLNELGAYSQKPLSVEPNAGKPNFSGGQLNYPTTPLEFALYARDFVELGANIVGGCCGTGPEHIRAMTKMIGRIKPKKRKPVSEQHITSRTVLKTTEPFLVVGERINASARKKLQPQLQQGDFSEILRLAHEQQTEGAQAIDLNPGIEKLLNAELIKRLVQAVDRHSSWPISFDFQEDQLLEVALQEYPGRPIINSSTAREENLTRRLEFLCRYGGLLVVLAMENDLPQTVEERIAAVDKALSVIKHSGISLERIYFDPLVLPHSTGNDYHLTLETIRKLKARGLKTIIGLSNLSFGLPDREGLNAAFLGLAVEAGLRAAILNTSELTTKKVLDGVLELKRVKREKNEIISEDPLLNLLLHGQKKELLANIQEQLKKREPLWLSQQWLRPAMEKIGQLYAERKIFLPHLILAAETAQAAFDYLNQLIPDNQSPKKARVLLATVEGDVHDIGKKIVATVLKSSGFEIIDLGRNVPADQVVAACQDRKPDLVGLSAMMTTTVDQVLEVKKALENAGLNLPVVAGGASMNRELADQFGVYYARDAVDALNLCQKLISQELKNESHRKN
ncbi:MAG: homocysteine methyltransferase [Candidatus Aminicenantes bacterium]|nr:MAG: homocysteine methyltransferase [Candidatus Aminicenantes bacterium]